ncbi:hypothetical protein FKM82_000828 [Ascaphus truei]
MIQTLIREYLGVEVEVEVEPLTMVLAKPIEDLETAESKMTIHVFTAARCAIAAAWKKVNAPSRQTVLRRLREIKMMELLSAQLSQKLDKFHKIWEIWPGN